MNIILLHKSNDHLVQEPGEQVKPHCREAVTDPDREAPQDECPNFSNRRSRGNDTEMGGNCLRFAVLRDTPTELSVWVGFDSSLPAVGGRSGENQGG